MHEKSRSSYMSLRCVYLTITLIVLAFGCNSAKHCKDDGDDSVNANRKFSQKQLEKFHRNAVRMVSTTKLRDNLEYFTKFPHFPGDPVNLDLAKTIQKKWKEYGFDSATLKKYIIMLSRPTKPGVVALYDSSGQEIYRSAPQETFLVPSENNSNVVPPFNAYSPPGSVKGKLLYANYGREKDFEALEKSNISCSGKIVIMRYENIDRPAKVRETANTGGLFALPRPEAIKGVTFKGSRIEKRDDFK